MGFGETWILGPLLDTHLINIKSLKRKPQPAQGSRDLIDLSLWIYVVIVHWPSTNAT